MKNRLIATLIGMLALLGSGAVLAHGDGYVYRPVPGINGAVSLWTDAYGNLRYGANLAYGAPLAYVAVPYRGRIHGSRSHHHGRHAYERDYYRDQEHRRGARHKSRHNHGKRHH